VCLKAPIVTQSVSDAKPFIDVFSNGFVAPPSITATRSSSRPCVPPLLELFFSAILFDRFRKAAFKVLLEVVEAQACYRANRAK
jgi:hypothetical protein